VRLAGLGAAGIVTGAGKAGLTAPASPGDSAWANTPVAGVNGTLVPLMRAGPIALGSALAALPSLGAVGPDTAERTRAGSPAASGRTGGRLAALGTVGLIGAGGKVELTPPSDGSVWVSRRVEGTDARPTPLGRVATESVRGAPGASVGRSPAPPARTVAGGTTESEDVAGDITWALSGAATAGAPVKLGAARTAPVAGLATWAVAALSGATADATGAAAAGTRRTVAAGRGLATGTGAAGTGSVLATDGSA
jgi:hypothetical protein